MKPPNQINKKIYKTLIFLRKMKSGRDIQFETLILIKRSNIRREIQQSTDLWMVEPIVVVAMTIVCVGAPVGSTSSFW